MKVLAAIVYWWRTGKAPSSAPRGICARCYKPRHLPVQMKNPRPVHGGGLVCLDCARWEEI